MSTQRKKRVLVVDDEVAVCMASTRVLERAGYSVTGVTSGSAALRLLASRRYDLLLADIVMPDIGGLALCLQVAKDYPQTKLLLMSGYSSAHVGVDHPGFPAHNFINKPFSRDDLTTQVGATLAGEYSDIYAYASEDLPDDLTAYEQRSLFALSLSRFRGLVHDLNSDLTILYSTRDFLSDQLKHAVSAGEISGSATAEFTSLLADMQAAVSRHKTTLDWYFQDFCRTSFSLSSSPWKVLADIQHRHSRVRLGNPGRSKRLRVLIPAPVLTLIINELVTNASKHAKPNSPILIFYKVYKNRLKVSVHDGGPPGRRAKVPWFRRRSLLERVPGDGQGLGIVREVVARAGGRLLFDVSDVSHGTSVTVVFPARSYLSRGAATGRREKG